MGRKKITTPCQFPKCEGVYYAAGWCRYHYKAQYKGRVLKHHKETEIERFWRYANPKSKSSCWLWVGTVNNNGYGIFFLKFDGEQGRIRLAHRYSYALHKGAIPAGLVVDHLCRKRRCVNPAHLEAVTEKENLQRAHKLRTHCSRQHLLSGDNVYYEVLRRCKTCRREARQKQFQPRWERFDLERKHGK